jgi:hypothetical protein
MSDGPTVSLIGALRCSDNFSFPWENIVKIIVFWTLEIRYITEIQINPQANVRCRRLSPTNLTGCATKHRPFKFQSVARSRRDCSGILIILNNKAEFERDMKFLNQPWNCFEELFISCNHNSWTLRQGRSRFRGTEKRWANVAFLPSSKYNFVTYDECLQEDYQSGPRIFGQSSFGIDVSFALNLNRIQSIILW